MKVIIQILNEEGAVIMEHQADALHPTQMKTHPEKPVPCGEYKLYGFVYQPIVQLMTKIGGF
jgi:hypothetical protein